MSETSSGSRLLASNTRQTQRTRRLAWGLTALPVGALAWGLAVDSLWMLLALLGAGMAGVMHLWLRRYVTSLALEGDELIVQTAAIGSPVHRVARARVGPRSYTSGPGRVGTYASAESPMIKFPIQGFRGSFVIDADIEVIDLEGIKRL